MIMTRVPIKVLKRLSTEVKRLTTENERLRTELVNIETLRRYNIENSTLHIWDL